MTITLAEHHNLKGLAKQQANTSIKAFSCQYCLHRTKDNKSTSFVASKRNYFSVLTNCIRKTLKFRHTYLRFPVELERSRGYDISCYYSVLAFVERLVAGYVYLRCLKKSLQKRSGLLKLRD